MTSHSFASTGGLDVDVLPTSAVQIDFIPDRIARSPSIVMNPFEDVPVAVAEGDWDAGEVDIEMESESAPNSATPLGSAHAQANSAGMHLNMPSTPPAMAGLAHSPSPLESGGGSGTVDDCAPPPPAYSTLAHSSRTFHLAPLLNGVPGEVELHTSDGKRFLVHKSVLEKETVFFHI
jgi:hypothetical protein